ncbi:hypothetical protein GCM10025857_30130 [Alicyclobacillus contaminans]|uniref:hypothetical protein n=1 Tax=Alicyclobacillus contaminans TaxID=392016 RepID=UPI00047975D4|nr:hypothetical protein [Alicyclobacillus contaminans]GMA51656.1 hypothetical protein GCM10025857_30130 [Alicyclobacillus contaminans]
MSAKTNHKDAIRQRNLAARAMPVFMEPQNTEQPIQETTALNSVPETIHHTEQNNKHDVVHAQNPEHVIEQTSEQSEGLMTFVRELAEDIGKTRVEDTHTRSVSE